MSELKNQVVVTFAGTIIPESVRGLLYICQYDYVTKTIEVCNAIAFDRAYDALQAFANIPNAESQLAMGGTREEFVADLTKLHDNLNNPDWVRELADYL